MQLIKKTINIYDLLDHKTLFSDAEFTSNSENDSCNDSTEFKIEKKINPNVNKNKINHEYIYIPIEINQSINLIGTYDNLVYIEGNSSFDEVDFILRLSEVNLQSYLTNSENKIIGYCDSKLSTLDVYGDLIIGTNYSLDPNYFSGVLLKTNEKIVYVLNAENNNGYVVNTGIKYTDYYNKKKLVLENGFFKEVFVTEFEFFAKGHTIYNTSLLDIVKDDNLIEIVEIKKTDSELDIDRGNIAIFTNFFILSEVNTFEDLQQYKNNIYNL